jgi:hypothetical protein
MISPGFFFSWQAFPRGGRRSGGLGEFGELGDAGGVDGGDHLAALMI